MKCLKEFITTTTQCVPYYNKTESYFYFVWKFKDFLLHYCHYEIWFSLVIQLSERTLFVLKDVSLDKFKIKKMPKQNIFADPTKRIRTIICCVVLYCILLRKYFYPTNLTYIDKNHGNELLQIANIEVVRMPKSHYSNMNEWLVISFFKIYFNI